MPVAKEELQERAQLVRIHEANCQIEHPTPEEANFRMATMKALGRMLNFKELRTAQLMGPGNVSQARPTTTPAKR